MLGVSVSHSPNEGRGMRLGNLLMKGDRVIFKCVQYASRGKARGALLGNDIVLKVIEQSRHRTD